MLFMEVYIPIAATRGPPAAAAASLIRSQHTRNPLPPRTCLVTRGQQEVRRRAAPETQPWHPSWMSTQAGNMSTIAVRGPAVYVRALVGVYHVLVCWYVVLVRQTKKAESRGYEYRYF